MHVKNSKTQQLYIINLRAEKLLFFWEYLFIAKTANDPKTEKQVSIHTFSTYAWRFQASIKESFLNQLHNLELSSLWNKTKTVPELFWKLFLPEFLFCCVNIKVSILFGQLIPFSPLPSPNRTRLLMFRKKAKGSFQEKCEISHSF